MSDGMCVRLQSILIKLNQICSILPFNFHNKYSINYNTMNIELTLKQEILAYVELKYKFGNLSYQQFCDMCQEAGMIMNWINLSMLINKVFGIGLEFSNKLAVAYFEGKNLNEFVLNLNVK